jgi:hypothetical protein
MQTFRGSVAGISLLAFAACLSACGGPPLSSKDDLARAIAGASVPSTGAKGALMALHASNIDIPAFTLHGSRGGKAKVTVNPLGVVVGIAGKGLMLDLIYDDYCEDGLFRLDGTLSVLAQFEYTAEPGDYAYADLKLSLVGRLALSGLYSDQLHANVRLTTRIHDLEFREGSIELRLDGAVDALEQRFEFAQEDLSFHWADAVRQVGR